MGHKIEKMNCKKINNNVRQHSTLVWAEKGSVTTLMTLYSTYFII